MLQVGAVGAGAAALGGATDARAGELLTTTSTPARTASFDEGWLFLHADPVGAEAPNFPDVSWRRLDLPHDFRIEDRPQAISDDGGATAEPHDYAYLTDPDVLVRAPAAIGPFASTLGGNEPPPLGRGQGWTVGSVGWYRKHFRVDQLGADQRIEVCFDGVYRLADVYLNGVKLGTNSYGYIPFSFDLTPHLRRDGDNVLAVRVDNTGQTGRWYTGSGIYRHTWLTVTGSVRIPTHGVYVTTPRVAERTEVRTEVEVDDLGADAARLVARVTVLDPDGRAVGTATSAAVAVQPGHREVLVVTQTISGTRRWSPSTPLLYTARVQLLRDGTVVDSVDQTFGIRTIDLDPARGFLLNGEPVKFAGANVHHDHGALGAVSLRRSEERRIEILKANGFNSYRASHNPSSTTLLDACDRLGMLVMEETFDQWTVTPKGKDQNPEFLQRWPEQLAAHMRRDRNHPSVIMWSIGNEIFSDPDAQGVKIAAAAKALDSSRPVMRGGFYDDAAWEYCDLGDVHYAIDNTATHEQHPDKVISQSESNPFAVFDNKAFEDAHPWMIGNWVWTGWDHIGEAGIGAPGFDPEGAPDTTSTVITGFNLVGIDALGGIPYPYFTNMGGDMDLTGMPRPQNAYRRVVYGLSTLEMYVERPMPDGVVQDPSPGGWSWYDELESWTWPGQDGREFVVHVYSPDEEVALLLNGAFVASVRPEKMIATLRVPYAPGTLVAISRRGGQEVARRTLSTVGAPAKLRLTCDVPSVTTSRDDLAHVRVTVLDAQDRPVPDAVVKVDFAVTGAGTLMGVANGNGHNVDSFQRPRRWTYKGTALAILRPAKTTGTMRLTATSLGLAPATVEIPVRGRKGASGATLSSPAASVVSAPALLLLAGLGALTRRRNPASEGS